MTLGRVLGLDLGVLFDFDDHWRDRRSFESANVYKVILRMRMLARRPVNQRMTNVGEKTSSVKPELTGQESSLQSHLSCVVIRLGVVEKGEEVEGGTASPKIYRVFFSAQERLRGGGRMGGAFSCGLDPHALGPAKPNCSGCTSACRYNLNGG